MVDGIQKFATRTATACAYSALDVESGKQRVIDERVELIKALCLCNDIGPARPRGISSGHIAADEPCSQSVQGLPRESFGSAGSPTDYRCFTGRFIHV